MKSMIKKPFSSNISWIERITHSLSHSVSKYPKLVNKLKIDDFGATFPHKVTFHDACSALREYGVKEEPRQLLRRVKGLELIEMNECETCCGFGGTFAVKNPDISASMAEQKVLNALETGAEYIVSTEASCLMNINGFINKHKLPVKGIHLADILAQF